MYTYIDVHSESDTAICASCRIVNNNIMVTYEGKYHISDGVGMLITFTFVIESEFICHK